MNPKGLINAVITTVVILAIAGALYPTVQTYITNITGTYANTSILTVVSVLYWILIAVGIVLMWVKGFGVGGMGGGKHY